MSTKKNNNNDEFKKAQQFVLSFGKYQGSTIDEVSITDAGLLYLDWLYGQKFVEIEHKELFNHLKVFFANPSIQKELDSTVG